VCLPTLAFASFLTAVPAFSQAANAQHAASATATRNVSYTEFPLAFEPNRGQAPSESRYTAAGHGFQLSLEKDRAAFQFQTGSEAASRDSRLNRLELKLLNANPDVQIDPAALQQGVSNYIASSSSQSQLNVAHYGRVTYRDLYPAIDLSFYGNQQSLEYDFRVKAGADSGRVQIAIAGTASASISEKGSLMLAVGGSLVEFLKPVAYQLDEAGKRAEVPVSYRLSKDGQRWLLSFAAAPYDRTRDLVIDPVLSYGEQLPSTNTNIGALAADAAGDVYIAGQSQLRGFYIQKFDPAGKSLFNTVIGSGGPAAYPTGIAVDASGNSYVTGFAATGLPATAGAYLNYAGKHSVPFIAELAANGATVNYLSYLGGTTGTDYSTGITLDSAKNVYITGYEDSTDFPTTAGSYLGTNPNPGYYSAFVAKINPAASGKASLVYSTLLDVTGVQSYGSGIAVDSSNNAYVSLISNLGYPVTTGAYNYNGLVSDSSTNGVYVNKVNPAGASIVYSAYLGPGLADAVAVDGQGDAYLTGAVYADDFPTTPGAYQTAYPGGFVSELNPAGTALIYSTFLSGPSGAFSPASNTVTPQQIVIPSGCASACAATIAGWTYAADFPAIDALQSQGNLAGSPTPFLVELAGNGASALYSTYLGGLTGYISYPYGAPLEPTPSVAIDGAGNAYLAANISGYDFPTTLPVPTPASGGYIAKVSASAGALIVADPLALSFDLYDPSGEAVGVSSTLTGIPVPLLLRNMGSTPVAISSITFVPATEFSETDSCAGAIPAGGICTLNLAFLPTAAGKRTATLSVASNAGGSPVTVALSGTAYAAGYLQYSAAGLNFGDQALGVTSALQTITISNIGLNAVGMQPITVSGLGGTKGTGADFNVLNNCPTTLAAGASCSVGVTFTPLATGLRGVSLYVSGNGFGNESITIYGTGISGTVGGTLSLSATTLNFNTQLVNTLSPSQSLTLINTSASPISISSVTIATKGETGANGFILATGNCLNASVIQIAPQATCSIGVRFEPSLAVSETGTITINDTAQGSPHTIALSGTGLAAAQALEFAPAGMVFPDTPTGAPSAAQNFYVYNVSTGPVTIDRVLVTGDFQILSSNCPGDMLKPGPAPGVDYNFSYECSLRMTFTPTATGVRNGTMTFVDNAGGTPQVLNLTGNGITATGAAFIEPASLNFGTQAAGTTSNPVGFTIANPGNSPVTINAITASGDYAVASECSSGVYPFVITAQRTCTGTLTFTPTATTNPRGGTLTVTSSAGTATSNLTGSGVTATAAIGITPTALNFGAIQEQVTSFTYTVYVRNAGTEYVTLTSGAASGDFAFSGGSCGFYGNLLAPGASCYVSVSLTPTAAGARTGTLTLTTSAGVTTAALTGTGSAAAPLTQIAPNGAAFDQVAVGKSSMSNIGFYFHNYSTKPITIKTAKITSGGSAFVIPPSGDGCTGQTLAASSGQCNVQVSFSPTAAGYLTGTLTYTDSASVTYSAALAGYAPSVSVSAYLSPGALAFPGQVITTPSSAQGIVLNNSSDVPLTVGALSGANLSIGTGTAGAFTANSNGGSDSCSLQVVAPRSKCSVGVVFAPTAAGSAAGTVVFPVTYGNGATATFTANLAGTGLAVKDAVSLYPLALNFPDQAVAATPNAGADSAQVLTLANTGNLPLTVGPLTSTDAVVGTTLTGDFTTAGAYNGYDGCSNQTLPPGGTCQVNAAFTPASAGAKSGKINFPVTYTDKTTKTLTATLTGKGIADGSKVVISPASGQFDVQVINTTSDSSQTLTFTLSNTGNLPVQIKQSTVTSYFFFVTDYCSGQTIGINTSCSITLSFTPRKTGVTTGTLTIPDSAAGNPHKVSLTGTGIAADQQIVLSQTAVNFGNQPVGTKSGPVYVYVTNQSGATVPINSVVLAGANASDFIESDTCQGQSLSGQALCSIAVEFSPAAASLGLRTATVTETDTASGSPRVISLKGTGIVSAPAAAFYPASLNFGSQALNTPSAPLSFSVTNTGTANLSITKVLSTNATEFKVKSQTCTGTPVPPTGTCLVTVVFEPNAGSQQTAAIQITDNAAASPQSLTVTGLSVGIPQAALKPASLAFGSVDTGITSAAQVITLSNAGTDTLKISGIAFTGTNPGAFAQTNTCGTSIVAGANCAISVTFKPATAGALSATLTVTDNAGNTAGSTQTATVGGTGVGVPKITFSKTSLTFAATNVGSSTAAQAITVTNSGTAALSISSVMVTPAGNFTETNTCGATVAIGGTCSISVIFSPTVAGAPLTASLTVTDNAAASPQAVALSGTGVGVAKASLSATTLNFNNQAVGIASAPLPVTLTNTGSGPLTVASLKIAGANPSDFTAASTACPGTLAPAANCVINVTFKPAANASYAATLTVTDNTGNVAGSTQVVTLSGVGIGTPAATFSPTSIAFGSQNAGTPSATNLVTLTDTGNGPLTITSIAVTGANAADFLEFSDCPASPSSVAVKGTCEIAVVFTPQAAGARTASVVVTDNSGGTAGAKQTIALTGTGAGAPLATLSATSLTYATTKTGSLSAGQSVTLTNTGNIPLSVASVVLAGANAADFSAFNTCTPTVKEGDNCIIVVFFKPTATGARAATVTLTDNSNNVTGATQVIQLKGTGN
jgi:hypothetical protein